MDSGVIKKRFKDIHQYHNKIFKQFMRSMNTIFKGDLTEDEYRDINIWADEYEMKLSLLRTVLEDFEEQIKNRTLSLTTDRTRDREISDEIMDSFYPYALMYWYIKTNSVEAS